MTGKESNLYLNWFNFQSINTEVSPGPPFHSETPWQGPTSVTNEAPSHLGSPWWTVFCFCGTALSPPRWVSDTKSEASRAIRATFLNDLGFAFVELISWLRQLIAVFNTLSAGQVPLQGCQAAQRRSVVWGVGAAFQLDTCSVPPSLPALAWGLIGCLPSAPEGCAST